VRNNGVKADGAPRELESKGRAAKGAPPLTPNNVSATLWGCTGLNVSPEAESIGSHRDWILLVPFALTLVPAAVFAYLYRDTQGFGGILNMVLGQAAAAPFAIAGLVWLLAVTLRRPFRPGDFVGWAARAWLALIAVLLLWLSAYGLVASLGSGLFPLPFAMMAAVGAGLLASVVIPLVQGWRAYRRLR
jgi:hypothetical protein